jgi:hypothetical protein
LEAERQSHQTKKRALEIASDELAKSHDTNSEFAATVERLKKGIDWRTLVMMRMDDENQSDHLNVVQCRVKQN